MGKNFLRKKPTKMRVILITFLIAFAAATELKTMRLLNNFQAMSHYGNPANGCRSDEQAIQVQGANGDACVPMASGNSCPTDVPSGTTAQPMPILQDQSGNKYCVLVCRGLGPTGTCPSGASCQAPSSRMSFMMKFQASVGICLYS